MFYFVTDAEANKLERLSRQVFHMSKLIFVNLAFTS